MMSPHDDTTPDSNYDASTDHTSVPPPAQSVEETIDKIDRILHQMLLLAELSASDSTVDRTALQKTLERLQSKIDRIADGM